MILGRAFYEVAALDSAAIHFRRAAADSTGIDAVGYMALIAARQAFPAQARIVADSLAVNPPRWDFGLTIYWRAAILGALGDRAQAVQLLRQASQRGQGMAGWHADDALVGLRDFPPFKTLVVAQK